MTGNRKTLRRYHELGGWVAGSGGFAEGPEVLPCPAGARQGHSPDATGEGFDSPVLDVRPRQKFEFLGRCEPNHWRPQATASATQLCRPPQFVTG